MDSGNGSGSTAADSKETTTPIKGATFKDTCISTVCPCDNEMTLLSVSNPGHPTVSTYDPALRLESLNRPVESVMPSCFLRVASLTSETRALGTSAPD